MLKNYFKSAFRNLVKNKLYSIINIVGLSISLSAAILLLLWVWDELSFDKMHSKGDRIFRAAAAMGSTKDRIWEHTSAPLAIFGKEELPEIEDACRIQGSNNLLLFTYRDKKFNEKATYADPNIFTLFNFQLLEGNPKKPFLDNRSIVLNETLAKKYFGNEPALGKLLQIKSGDSYKVTGIMKDMPLNSSLQYDLLLPFDILAENRQNNPLNNDWGNFDYQTYFLLRPSAAPENVGKQLAVIHRKNQPSEFFKDLTYLLQPLEKMHLYDVLGHEQGMRQVKIFLLVAFVILLIACINYVNLVTARSTRRSKEVSVRKVVGANKSHLFYQFLTESSVVFLISIIIAIALIFTFMPLYNDLSGKQMVFSLFDAKVWFLFGCTMIVILGAAGVYPALMLSKFNPALALKGILPGLGQNNGFRRLLVVLQFSCSIVLIISTLIIGKQLTYIRNADLGFAKESVFTFSAFNFTKNYEAIRDELQRQPGVLGVTTASQSVMNLMSSTGDFNWDGKPANMNNFIINQLSVDRNFPDVMDMKLIDGKGFTGTAADSAHFIINETALKQTGLQNPIGKPVTFHDQAGTIVGVVKDFHFKDMKTKIEPCILFINPHWGWNTIYIKTTGKEAKAAVNSVENLWKRYNADYEFNYKFMDDAFDEMYRTDIRSGKLFNIFASIAILLSCLGLFGLVTFTAETKVKEIGIRKTLGASVNHIILLISKDFLRLVGISFLVAFPLAWWMMGKWLENYVYRTEIQIWVFIVAGLTAFLIAAITVCGKALKAAQSNPVKSLRSE
jgi:putative ABC transport system permease protein